MAPVEITLLVYRDRTGADKVRITVNDRHLFAHIPLARIHSALYDAVERFWKKQEEKG